MKIPIYLLAFLFLSFGSHSTMSAQELKLENNERMNFSFIIPSMQELIDAALVHNSMVNYRKTEIEAKKMNLRSKKNYWTRNFGFQADSRYGTFDNFSTNDVGQSTTIFNSTSRQFNYGLGIYIKFPIFDAVNRKTQINQAKNELEQAKFLAEFQKDELIEVVIRTYEETLLKQRILEINSQNYGSAVVNMEMVEKEFRNGIIPITEYVRINDMTSRIKTEFEKSRSDFIVAKKLLENLVGFSFDTNIN